MAPNKRTNKSKQNQDENGGRMQPNRRNRGKRPATSFSTSSDHSTDSDYNIKHKRKRRNRRNVENSTDSDDSEGQDESDGWVDDALEDSTSDSSSDDEFRRRINPAKPINCFGNIQINEKETYFRSNLRTFVKEINSLTFSDAHICWIKRTPFWLLFEGTYGFGDQMLLRRVRKNDDSIRKIIKCFDQPSGSFFIGGKVLDLERRDAQLIFGISCGNTHISLKESDYKFPNWMHRCFPEEIRRLPVCQFVLYKNLVLTKLKGALLRTDIDSIKDVARLFSLYVLAILLCPNQNSSVAVHLSCYFESLSDVCNYDWSTLIVEALRMQLKANKNLKAGGCAVMLPFWLCEHAVMLKPTDKLAFPRFLKWDLHKVNKHIRGIKLTKQAQIRKLHLKATSDEKIKLRALIDHREVENLNESQQEGRAASDWSEGVGEKNASVNQNKCTSIVLLQSRHSQIGSFGRGLQSGEGCSFNATSIKGNEGSKNNGPNFNSERHHGRNSCFSEGNVNVQFNGSQLLGLNTSPSANPVHMGESQIPTIDVGKGPISHLNSDSRSIFRGALVEKNIELDNKSQDRCSVASKVDVAIDNKSASKENVQMNIQQCNPPHPEFATAVGQDELEGVLNVGCVGKVNSETPSWSLGFTQEDANQKEASQRIDQVIADLSAVVEDIANPNLPSSPDVARNLFPDLDSKVQLENFVDVNVQSDSVISDMENQVVQLETEVVGLKESLLEKDKLIQKLFMEKDQLQVRINEFTFTVPSATQVFSNPDNLDQMDASVDLHVLRESNKELLMENSYLKNCLSELCKTNQQVKPETSNAPTQEGSTADVKNLKRCANHPDPSTITRAVKRRTVNDDRITKEITPQPNTRELIKIGEGDQALGRNKAKVNSSQKFVLNEKMPAVKHLRTHIKEKLLDDWEFKGPDFIVWKGIQLCAEVSVQNMIDVLEEGRISFEVIDAWADIYQSFHLKHKPCVKYTVTFTATCWSLINDYGGTKDKNLLKLIDNRIEEALGAEWVLFPILGRGGSHRHSGSSDHWTLLKLNVKKGEWRFLNSILQRKGRLDIHLRDAFVVVKYIDKKFRDACKRLFPNHPYMKKSLQLPQTEDCLQQYPGTLDCGVIVCYHIENTMIGKPSKKGEYSITCSGNYRKRMVEMFMDPTGSKI